MKKVYGIFAVCLLLGLVTYDAAMETIVYDLNYYIKTYLYMTEMNGVNPSIAGIFYIFTYVLAGGCINFIFSWLFAASSKKEIKQLLNDSEDISNLRKKKNFLIGINLIAYSFGAIMCFGGMNIYNEEAIKVISEWEQIYPIEYVSDYWHLVLLRPYSNIFVLLSSILIHFGAVLPIFRLLKIEGNSKEKNEATKLLNGIKMSFKIALGVLLLLLSVMVLYKVVGFYLEDMASSGDLLFLLILPVTLVYFILILPINEAFRQKVWDITSKIIVSFLFVLAFAINIYHYIAIQEFEYVYYWDNLGIVCCEYSDIRKIINKVDYIVPEKIWGKDVERISNIYSSGKWLYPEVKVVLPNTIKWNKIMNSDKSVSDTFIKQLNNEIVIKVE